VGREIDHCVVVSHRIDDAGRIEKVDRDRLGSGGPQRACLLGGPCKCTHVVAGPHDLRDRATAEHAGRAGDKDLHQRPSPSSGVD